MKTPFRLQRICLTLALAASPLALAGNDLAALDGDADGSLTRAEYEAAIADGFARIDSDGDGTLSAPEMGTWLRFKGIAGARAGTEQLGATQIAVLDQDRDGRLSKAENTHGVETRFAGLDADADGVVTRIEWQTGGSVIDREARVAADVDEE
jgi:hypothetical protein